MIWSYLKYDHILLVLCAMLLLAAVLSEDKVALTIVLMVAYVVLFFALFVVHPR